MINKTISEECGFPVVAHQLVYACTTGVVRPTEPTSSITNTIFSDNFIRILRLYLTHYLLISYACVYFYSK